MEENESGRKRKIVFAVNGLTKSGQMLFITIPAKIGLVWIKTPHIKLFWR